MWNNYTMFRGASMPQYDDAYGDNWLPRKWHVKPIGLKGIWGIRKFKPFLSGDKLELELVVESDDHNSRDYEYAWVLLRRLPDYKEDMIDQDSKPIIVNKGKTPYPLKPHLLQYEGEYRLFLTLTSKGRAEPHKQTMANFKVLARDVYYVDWEMRLGIGFIGAVLGLLAGLLINRIN